MSGGRVASFVTWRSVGATHWITHLSAERRESDSYDQNGVAKHNNVARTPQLPLYPAMGSTKASIMAAKQITPSVLTYPLAEINVSTIAQTNRAHQPLKGKGWSGDVLLTKSFSDNRVSISPIPCCKPTARSPFLNAGIILLRIICPDCASVRIPSSP